MQRRNRKHIHRVKIGPAVSQMSSTSVRGEETVGPMDANLQENRGRVALGLRGCKTMKHGVDLVNVGKKVKRKT
jgi:hypothetical protein